MPPPPLPKKDHAVGPIPRLDRVQALGEHRALRTSDFDHRVGGSRWPGCIGAGSPSVEAVPVRYRRQGRRAARVAAPGRGAALAGPPPGSAAFLSLNRRAHLGSAPRCMPGELGVPEHRSSDPTLDGRAARVMDAGTPGPVTMPSQSSNSNPRSAAKATTCRSRPASVATAVSSTASSSSAGRSDPWATNMPPSGS